MKKLLMVLLVLVVLLTNTTTAQAKIEYYEPLHIVNFVESKGYCFDFNYTNTRYEKGYLMNNKKVICDDANGYLRSVAHAYDNITKVSDSNDFRNALDVDFDSLAMMYYDYGVEFANTREAFIEAFMV